MPSFFRGFRLALGLGVIICLLAKVSPAEAEKHHGRSEKMKQRLEQLFIWRVSDRLQLTPAEESKFTDEFHKLSEERAKLSQDLDVTLDQIDKEKDNSDKTSKLLADYTSELKKYNSMQGKEMDAMSHLFGTKKMVQYVLLKREMTQKFRDVLSIRGDRSEPVVVHADPQVSPQTGHDANEKTSANDPVLKEPQVIEQK